MLFYWPQLTLGPKPMVSQIADNTQISMIVDMCASYNLYDILPENMLAHDQYVSPQATAF